MEHFLLKKPLFCFMSSNPALHGQKYMDTQRLHITHVIVEYLIPKPWTFICCHISLQSSGFRFWNLLQRFVPICELLPLWFQIITKGVVHILLAIVYVTFFWGSKAFKWKPPWRKRFILDIKFTICQILFISLFLSVLLWSHWPAGEKSWTGQCCFYNRFSARHHTKIFASCPPSTHSCCCLQV